MYIAQENIVRKGEIACITHSHNVFYPIWHLFFILNAFKMSSAICLILDQSKILSSGNGLKELAMLLFYLNYMYKSIKSSYKASFCVEIVFGQKHHILYLSLAKTSMIKTSLTKRPCPKRPSTQMTPTSESKENKNVVLTLCNIMATKTISVRCAVDMDTAAPMAIPSAGKTIYSIFKYKYIQYY